MTVHVIGASGRLGRRVVLKLTAQGRIPIAIGRDSSKLDGLPLVHTADLRDQAALQEALADAKIIISCAHARYTQAILDAAPESARLVLTGSARRYTSYPDAAAREVVIAETLLVRSGRGVMIHPTMIYGGDENNLQRMAAYIRRFGVVPLPNGGTSLVQPIHYIDVAKCLVSAALAPVKPQGPIVAAGPVPVRYRYLVRAVANAIDRPVRIVSLPASMMMLGARVTRLLPGLPPIEPAEVQRLCEDKAFPLAGMRRLGVVPRSLEEGLAEAFGTSHGEPTVRDTRRNAALLGEWGL